MTRKIILIICASFLICTVHGQVWIPSFEQAKTTAVSSNKLILVDFYADWCGPCKTMDMETWNKPEVKKQMTKMVAAKINIDFNQSVALQYNVKAIPAIVIMDGYGNVLHQDIGFKTEEYMIRLLSGLPENVEELSLPLAQLNDDPKNPNALFEVALGYQKMAKISSGKGQEIFLGESNAYLTSARKFYKKEKKIEKTECVDLLKCYNKIIRGQTKSAMKELNKHGIENFKACNLSLAYFVLVNGYMELQETEKAKTYFEKLKLSASNEEYVAEIENVFPDLAQI